MIDAVPAFEPWLTAVVAVAALHLLVAWYARRAADDSTSTVDPSDYVDAGVVTCPTCGVENELGYRFCRDCVDELPGSDGRLAASGPTRSGSAF